MKTEENITSKATFLESPLGYICHSSEDMVLNWYKARAYVLHLIKVELSKSKEMIPWWHFIVENDSGLMLAVVRHLALYAHFITYEECDKLGNPTRNNKTVITLCTRKKTEKIETTLKTEDNLFYLTKYCETTIFGHTQNKNSFIDIALEVVKKDERSSYGVGKLVTITEEEVIKWCDSQVPENITKIDTRKAVYASKIYELGGSIDNLKYEDINNTKRYNKALDIYQYSVLNESLLEGGKYKQLIDKEKWESNYDEVRKGMSNIICADCFGIREKEVSILLSQSNGKLRECDVWGKHIVELSQCEHNRWVVEKLILGYEPFGKKERLEYESLFGDQRKKYRDQLKNRETSPMHINICSNKDLRRIDPDNMKYDSFLMLAVPRILKEIRTENEKYHINP